ncbi:hypothetical protein JKP88DRAFT_272681 [Tribonema minus]|uniref:Uncharacterized protein n=1 Tax=Tribonema minus TaxID=303371 RepID=A0A835Z424_9STRA|nr:hypothetical protein JKP88DRAFT_272681 [Tribonema minus]
MQSPPTPPSMYGGHTRRYFDEYVANKENIDPNSFYSVDNIKRPHKRTPLGSLSTHQLRSNYTELMINATCKYARERDVYEMKQLEKRHEDQKQKLSKKQGRELSKMKLDQTVAQALRHVEITTRCEHKLATMTDTELLMDLCTVEQEKAKGERQCDLASREDILLRKFVRMLADRDIVGDHARFVALALTDALDVFQYKCPPDVSVTIVHSSFMTLAVYSVETTE